MHQHIRYDLGMMLANRRLKKSQIMCLFNAKQSTHPVLRAASMQPNIQTQKATS